MKNMPDFSELMNKYGVEDAGALVVRPSARPAGRRTNNLFRVVNIINLFLVAKLMDVPEGKRAAARQEALDLMKSWNEAQWEAANERYMASLESLWK